jgi:hypothetical protein
VIIDIPRVESIRRSSTRPSIKVKNFPNAIPLH